MHSLRLPPAALSELTTGYLMQLMTTDIQKFREVFMSIMQLFTGPLTIIACITVLIIYVGAWNPCTCRVCGGAWVFADNPRERSGVLRVARPVRACRHRRDAHCGSNYWFVQ